MAEDPTVMCNIRTTQWKTKIFRKIDHLYDLVQNDFQRQAFWGHGALQ